MKNVLKNKFNNYFSTGPKVVLIVVLLVIGITIAIYSTRKTIVVFIGSKEVKLVTYQNTFREALKADNIVVGPNDKTTPGLDTKVKNGDRITIKKAINIEVAIDGKILMINSAEDNIGQMLAAEKITVGAFDKVSPSINQTLTQGLKISVIRVKIDLVNGTKSIAFDTVQKPNDAMQKGISKIIQEGQTGEKKIITKTMYENGKEMSRQVVSQVTNKQPVEKIIMVGTLVTMSNASCKGTNVLNKTSIGVEATAYTPNQTGGWTTASGCIAKRNANGFSTIAVDPRVIPLGTKVYVDGYGYAVAEDTGGAIKGNRIDVFFTSNSEAFKWGVRSVNMYILT